MKFQKRSKKLEFQKKSYEIPKFQIVREKIGIPKKFHIKFQKNGGRRPGRPTG